MKFYAYFFCCVLFVACTSKTNLTTDIDELYAAIPKDSLKELLSYSGFPDSTLTESQLETKKKMILLLEEYLTVVDNQFVLLAKPEDFEKAGLSKYYHTILQKEYRDVNHYIDSMGIKDLKEKFESASLDKGITLYSIESEVE